MYRPEKIIPEVGDHDLDYDFCHHVSPDPAEVNNPYDEDKYCCWCGNGEWKLHGPDCRWADAHGV